jgi:hypothetical protein
MFRKREKEVEREKPVETVSPVSISIKNNEKFQSFHDEAVYVIQLLKKKGDDIYDENRFGGMYLHGNEGFRKQNMKIFKSASLVNKENDEEQNSTVENIFQKLLNN